MLVVRTPESRTVERSYVVETILADFLGLPWRMVAEDRADTRIEMEGSEASLTLPDQLLSLDEDIWLTEPSLPSSPLRQWDAGEQFPEANIVDPVLPVLFGTDNSRTSADTLPLDIFGSCFFMLTRYEEVAAPVADLHGRYPARASLAYRENFLERPIVNEYVEVLWNAMRRLWPQLSRKIRQGFSFVTCDVDEPYSASSRSLPTLVKQFGGDLLKRRAPGAAVRRARGFIGRQFGHDRWDAANSFDWMMDVNEKAGNKMAFYFIADKTVPGLDGSAEIVDPFVIDLMSKIHRRGHEVGLHGSYGTFDNPGQLRRELGLLRTSMERAGVVQDEIGSRQHFLRWQTPVTARALAEMGIAYDTTLSFADRPGFRCGTCVPFRLFDLESRQVLPLWERPLIAMEVSVIDEQYMGLGYSREALELMLRLKRNCLRFGGEFVFLWHNSHFMTGADRRLYVDVLTHS